MAGFRFLTAHPPLQGRADFLTGPLRPSPDRGQGGPLRLTPQHGGGLRPVLGRHIGGVVIERRAQPPWEVKEDPHLSKECAHPVELVYVHTDSMVADILTKALCYRKHAKFTEEMKGVKMPTIESKGSNKAQKRKHVGWSDMEMD